MGITSSNKTLMHFGPPFAKGREGEIRQSTDNPCLAAKVFRPEFRTPEREQKIETMCDAMQGRKTTYAAWPRQIVFVDNKFVGYIMDFIPNTVKLRALGNFLSNSAHIKNLTLKDRISIAKSICAAFDEMHSAGFVIGDMNPDNILVNLPSKQVILVDTDSFHIPNPAGGYFRCLVGTSEYFPPELQRKLQPGTKIEDILGDTYSKETDLFGLAIHIYQLLMNDQHPFSYGKDMTNLPLSQIKAVTDTNPPRETNILKCVTPFNQKRGYSIPLYSPEPSSLPKYIYDAFRKTFIDGHSSPFARVSASDWWHHLERFEKALKACPANSRHLFRSNLSDCPWCALNKRIATTGFLGSAQNAHPSVTVGTSRTTTVPTATPRQPISTPRLRPKKQFITRDRLLRIMCAGIMSSLTLLVAPPVILVILSFLVAISQTVWHLGGLELLLLLPQLLLYLLSALAYFSSLFWIPGIAISRVYNEDLSTGAGIIAAIVIIPWTFYLEMVFYPFGSYYGVRSVDFEILWCMLSILIIMIGVIYRSK